MMTLLLLGGLSLPAHADAAGDAVLTTVDAMVDRINDEASEYVCLTTESGKQDREMVFKVEVMGSKRLVEFLAPGDMKGTRVLSLSHNQMYVYLPAYNKVRRVASHVTTQGFMGTTFSHADMATSRLGEVYTGSVTAETEGEWQVRLSPKTEAPYARVDITVDREMGVVTRYAYFNEGGEHIKTETRTGYSCEGDYCAPAEIKMVDHTQGDAASTLTRRTWSVNTGVDDARFSVRTLQRGG